MGSRVDRVYRSLRCMKLDCLLGHRILEFGLAALGLGSRVYCLILASGLGFFGSKIQASGYFLLQTGSVFCSQAANKVCSSQNAQSNHYGKPCQNIHGVKNRHSYVFPSLES